MHALEPKLLKPSPLRWLAIAALCLFFIVTAVAMIRSGEAMGWLVGGFFGLGLLVVIAYMLPGAAYLKLDAQGFTMCSLYRAHTYRWSDVTGFGVGRVALNKMVMFNFSPTYTRTPGLRSFSKDMVGFEAGLPDAYGMKHQDLADLLNRYMTAAHARGGADAV